MAYPFPDSPITVEVVSERVQFGDWKAAKCPLCDANAGTWHMENSDAARYICPTCQRFVLTGPRKAALELHPEQKPLLSAYAAASTEPADFTLDASTPVVVLLDHDGVTEIGRIPDSYAGDVWLAVGAYGYNLVRNDEPNLRRFKRVSPDPSATQ